MIYLLSFLTTFIGVGLKGFQHKNVIGNHLKSVFITSYVMAVFDVISVALVIQGGWTLVFSAGTGAALGMVLSIKFHDWIYG